MTPLFEYDLYYPAAPPAGEHAADDKLHRLKKQLTEFFGGLTDFRHRSAGSWQLGGVTFHDEVVLLRMLHSDQTQARSFLRDLKEKLEAELSQQQVLIIEREVSQFD
ncbi:MAG: hypothetical protein ACJ8MR_12730 [Povalibacter sp.]|jgi:hypothetical protein